MMIDFRGGGSKMTPKNRTLEGKNRMLGGGGVKNRRKSSDIIYVRSLSMLILDLVFGSGYQNWVLDVHNLTVVDRVYKKKVGRVHYNQHYPMVRTK